MGDKTTTNRLRELRKATGKSGTIIAEMLGITTQYYYDLETGRKRLNEDLIRQLADIFGVSIDYLLCRTDTINGPLLIETHTNGLTDGLPDEAIKELEYYVNFLQHKWKGWKKGDPPRN